MGTPTAVLAPTQQWVIELPGHVTQQDLSRAVTALAGRFTNQMADAGMRTLLAEPDDVADTQFWTQLADQRLSLGAVLADLATAIAGRKPA